MYMLNFNNSSLLNGEKQIIQLCPNQLNHFLSSVTGKYFSPVRSKWCIHKVVFTIPHSNMLDTIQKTTHFYKL